MDYLFLFLISTGFVGGAIKGLKKSLKSLLCLLLTFAIFSLIFIHLKDFIVERGFLKTEITAFIVEKFGHVEWLSTNFSTKAELSNALQSSPLPSFLKICLKNYIDKAILFSLGEVVANFLYEFVVYVALGVVLFIIIK